MAEIIFLPFAAAGLVLGFVFLVEKLGY
jgi:hypothetical protein